jgi:hypothetical protein
MALVDDLRPEDNQAPALATATVTAGRIGNRLRERFESFIHKRECESTQSDYDVKMASRAIGAFVIHHLGLTDDNTAGQSVCDSSDDGGIDAIYVNHTEKNVVIVQAKFNQSGRSTWTNNDFLTFKSACERLQQEEFKRFDSVLRNMKRDISTALSSIDYTFQFVMAHTGKRGAASTILNDMQGWQAELNIAAIVEEGTPSSELPFQVHLVSAEDILEWLRLQSSSTVDLSDVEIEHYGRVESPYIAYYGVVGGDQINEWWEQYSSKLFTKNIRNLLGQTEVNDSIRVTALENPELFWFYNNGITVLVREIEPHRRNSDRERVRGRFNFKDVSVINGAQTVSSIGSIASKHPNRIGDIKVQVRFIHIPEGTSDNVINSITRANNHQNRVLGRDFASQHREQLRLRDELIIEGYTYQLLRSDAEDAIHESSTINIDESLNALACLTGVPSTVATLKSQRGKFFDNLEGSQYRSVFNSSVSGIKLINVVRHQRVIDKMIKDKLANTDYHTDKKRYGILTHANRVFASHLLNNTASIKNSNNLLNIDKSALKTEFELILGMTETLIETRFNTAYPARFFSNVEKIGLTFNYLKNR